MSDGKPGKPAPMGNDYARKHGIHSFEDNGPTALDELQRGRLVELEQAIDTRAGRHELLKRRVAAQVLIAELAEGWLRREIEAGKPFDTIGILKRLSTYQEAARRGLLALEAALPDDSDTLTMDDWLDGKGRNGK